MKTGTKAGRRPLKHKNPVKRAVIAERVAIVEELLLRCVGSYSIRKICRERFGVQHEAADKYIARAREAIRAAGIETLEANRLDAVARIRSLIRRAAEKGELDSNIRAEKLLAEIEGTLQPRTLRLTDGAGGALKVDTTMRVLESLTDEQLRQLDSILPAVPTANEGNAPGRPGQSGGGAPA
jgi:hypothetical protein